MNEQCLRLIRDIDDLAGERDAAIARAEKAETWIKAHENYLGAMERGLCRHPCLGVLISDVQEWFTHLVWFDFTTLEPTAVEEVDDDRG